MGSCLQAAEQPSPIQASSRPQSTSAHRQTFAAAVATAKPTANAPLARSWATRPLQPMAGARAQTLTNILAEMLAEMLVRVQRKAPAPAVPGEPLLATAAT